MQKRKPWALQKTIYVPVECANDVKDAIDLVTDISDVSSPVDLCENWDVFGVEASPYADADGICEMTEQDASLCEIVEYVRKKGE